MAALLTAVLGLVMQTPPLQLLDGWAFDSVTRLDRATPPRVLIIEKADAVDPAAFLKEASRAGIDKLGVPPDSAVSRLCGLAPSSLQLVLRQTPGLSPEPSSTGSCAITPEIPAPADYGIRRQLAGTISAGQEPPQSLFEAVLAGRTDAPPAYLVRMPQGQNIPRIAAEQLVSGSFADGALNGYVALLEPGGAAAAPIATSLDPAATVMTPTLLSAYAIQTLIDRSEVVRAPFLLALASLFLAALAGRLFLRRGRVRLRFVLTCSLGAIAVAAIWLGLLQTADRLLPLSAMILALTAGALTKLLDEERSKDRRLERTMENAINLSFEHSVFHKTAEIPELFRNAAALLGMTHARMDERGRGAGEWREVFAVGAPAPDAQTMTIGDSEHDYRFAYALPDGPAKRPVARILADAVTRLSAGREWQSRLLAARGSDAIDRRLRSAANLIAIHSDELARGLDALDTGVFIFRPLGLPIQANMVMRELLTAAGIDPETTSLVDTLVELTELDPARARAMVREVLLSGGEMRLPMHDLGARQRVLRLGIASRVRHRSQTVLVLEAVDITDLDRLAELRLAVGTFIDRQLRNDLEAIALGTDLAKDPRLEPDPRGRILDRISDVVRRANNRLEEVRDLLEEEPGDTLDACYPVEARRMVQQAAERTAPYALELGVQIDSILPEVSGFSMAEPMMLSDMIEAMLRIVIADTAQGGKVTVALSENEEVTAIEVQGGFGLPFDRFMRALDAKPGEVPSEYQIAAAGIAETLKWHGAASYWSAAGKGFRFTIRLRRV